MGSIKNEKKHMCIPPLAIPPPFVCLILSEVLAWSGLVSTWKLETVRD